MKNSQEPDAETKPSRLTTFRTSSESGQTTAEYALVLLAAATIAMLVVAWAQSNGAIGDLFDSVIERVTSLIT